MGRGGAVWGEGAMVPPDKLSGECEARFPKLLPIYDQNRDFMPFPIHDQTKHLIVKTTFKGLCLIDNDEKKACS